MHRPWTGTPSASPKVAAVIRPTRSPVYGPGPTPTTMPVTASSLQPGLGEDPVDGGQQQFPVPARVHLARLGDDGRPVVQGDGDGGGGGIQSEQEHANSLRRPRPRARPPRSAACALLLPSPQIRARTRTKRWAHRWPGAARDSWPGSPRRPSPRSASSPTRPRRTRPQRPGAEHRPPSTPGDDRPKAPRDTRRTRGAARAAPARVSGSSTRWTTTGCGWWARTEQGHAHLHGHAEHGRPGARAPTWSPRARPRSPGSDGIADRARRPLHERRRRRHRLQRGGGRLDAAARPRREDRAASGSPARTATRCGSSRRSARRSSWSRSGVGSSGAGPVGAGKAQSLSLGARGTAQSLAFRGAGNGAPSHNTPAESKRRPPRMTGLVTRTPFKVYSGGFPPELVRPFEERIGRKVLGNKSASGTEILKELGEEHLRTGSPILYTSGDSVFQVAAHEDLIPPDELYRICRDRLRARLPGVRGVPRHRAAVRGRHARRPSSARPTAAISRSRPAGRRCSTAWPPPAGPCSGWGRSRTSSPAGASRAPCTRSRTPTASTRRVKAMDELDRGLIFTNLVDFDTLYGHRNDVPGFAANLESLDARLPDVLGRMRRGRRLHPDRGPRLRPRRRLHRPHPRERPPPRARRRASGRAGSWGSAPPSPTSGRRWPRTSGCRPSAAGTSFLRDL